MPPVRPGKSQEVDPDCVAVEGFNGNIRLQGSNKLFSRERIMEFKRKLLSGTVIPVVIGVSVAVSGGIQPASGAFKSENPTAIPRGADSGGIILASCNPCGACNPCNP